MNHSFQPERDKWRDSKKSKSTNRYVFSPLTPPISHWPLRGQRPLWASRQGREGLPTNICISRDATSNNSWCYELYTDVMSFCINMDEYTDVMSYTC